MRAAPHNTNHDPRGCERKRKYGSRRRAKQVCKIMGQKHGDHMFPYFCEVCRQWHVGHNDRRLET